MKTCLVCGTLTPNARCPAHQTPRRPRPTTLTRDWAERQRRAQAVAQHRAAHGNTCPGWNRPPHTADDLTADHITAVAAGGPADGPLAVLCRSCNSAKAARPA